MQCKIEHGRITLVNMDNFKTFFDAEIIYLADIKMHEDLVMYFVS